MRSSDQEYEVVFPASYEGQWEEECSFKGWLSGVIVRLRGGDEFTLVFVDMHRLAQMMEDQIAAGVGYLAEPGLVIVSEVRRSNMEAAIQGLVRERFFESLRPAHPSAQAPTA